MNKLPVIALVGRPNVGKSTLFNRLTKTRDALVDDQPGVTRDRLYGIGERKPYRYLVVDTGGLESEETNFSVQIMSQVDAVIEEADFVVFLLDHQSGLVNFDKEIAEKLRQCNVHTTLVINKSEGIEPELAVSEFQELALGIPIPISAKRGDGIDELINHLLVDWIYGDSQDSDSTITIAVAGRPNVGKSTLVNKIVGENRVLVSDYPGTTRDSVSIPIEYKNQPMTLIDTAGVRRKSRVDDVIEKFSVIKTLQSIEQAHVVIMVLDAQTEISVQDMHIAGMIRDLGRSLVVIVNKWDGLSDVQRKKIKHGIQFKFPFLPNPKILFTSALYGSNLDKIMPAVAKTAASATVSLATSSLNRTLKDAVDLTSPPMYQQRPVRLKFAHQAGKNPPVIVVHGNLAETIPDAYRRYLENFFIKAYRLIGTPIRIIPRTTVNPYAEKLRANRKIRSKIEQRKSSRKPRSTRRSKSK